MPHPPSPHAPRRGRGPLRRALILENPDPLLDEALEAMGIEPQRLPEPPDEGELVAVLEAGRHDLLFKRSRVPVTERVLRASDKLAAVMLCCIGDDSVDKDAAATHGVMVMNDPVSNGRSVAELVVGEIIALSRRLFESVFELREGLWRKDNRARFEVMGKRLGVLGLGKIGRQVAQLAEALEMEVVFHDTAEISREIGLAMGFRAVGSIDELFRVSDIVTVHVSAQDTHGRSNAGLLRPEHFAAFASGPASRPRIFLNLARGFVVAPETLRGAVRAGHVSYAITDVYPDEPPRSTSTEWSYPYADEPRIFGTPHIGAATREAQPRIARYMARTTQLFSHFGMIRNSVFRARANVEFPAIPDEAAAMLAVVHADQRGTKKAVDDAIFAAGASNVRSAHVDFPRYGVAYDLSALDRALTVPEVDTLIHAAEELTGDPTAIRWARTIPLHGDAHQPSLAPDEDTRKS